VRPFALEVTRKPGLPGLEVMTDPEGSIVVGWVAPGVLYAKFGGGLSGRLGSAFAAKLRELVEGKTSIRYFIDSSALQHYDLLARSAVTRVLLAKRRAFESFIMLTWAGEIGPGERAFADALGSGVDIVSSKDDFEAKLYRVAPAARQLLDPKTWVRRPTPTSQR
jgi:hypothetical protein